MPRGVYPRDRTGTARVWDNPDWRKAARKRYYDKHRTESMAKSVEDRRAKADFIAAYKAAAGCLVCAEAHPSALDFHHKDPTQKDFEVNATRGVGWARMRREIAKCAVLCSNCHRKFHAGVIALPTEAVSA